MKILHLFPTIYSKTQTIKEAVENLIKFPEQGTNSPKAFEYSMEFFIKIGRRQLIGTLSEFKDDADIFILNFIDGKINVKKDNNIFTIIENIQFN